MIPLPTEADKRLDLEALYALPRTLTEQMLIRRCAGAEDELRDCKAVIVQYEISKLERPDDVGRDKDADG